MLYEIMKNKKSTISVSDVKFCCIEPDEADCLMFADKFIYDERHDFIVDANFCGIAAKISFDREIDDRGVRRQLSICLIDSTLRCTVATRHAKLTMSKNVFFKDVVVCFTSKDVELKAGHTYRLMISDETASETLMVQTFHLFGEDLGEPTNWYVVDDGGVRPSWDDNFYKSLNTIDLHDYYVRFNVNPNFGAKVPEILPELEIRLHYPNGEVVDVRFMEPRCSDYESNSYYVQIPLITSEGVNGIFYAELLCMQYVVAGFVFATNVEDERGCWFGSELAPLEEYSPKAAKERFSDLLPDVNIPNEFDEALDEALEQFIQSQSDEQASEDVEEEQNEIVEEEETMIIVDNQPHILSLDDLTGLEAVKKKMNIYERLVRFNKMRKDLGLHTPEAPLHAMFLGSPGTGKTTVAKLIGQMLKDVGVLSSGHIVVRERATLIGKYYSSESDNTLKALEQAQGGILLIDEAYQLYQPHDPKDPGRFVIETLLTALADESKRDWMLILAGYPDEMMRMFDMNPGLKSRIPANNIYQFDDFSSAELFEIAENYLARFDYRLSQEAKVALCDRLTADYVHRDKTFGNARHVMNMIQIGRAHV